MKTDHILRCLRMMANSAGVRRIIADLARRPMPVIDRLVNESLGFGKFLRLSSAELFRAAYGREGQRLRLDVAAMAPLNRQMVQVLMARGEKRIWDQIAALTDVFVPSDYSSLPLWSTSPESLRGPQSVIEASSDPLSYD